MKRFLGNQKGFTLVELMIAIVIVGVLAAVAIPIYRGNIKKAKMSECDAALGTIRTGLRVYYAEHSAYPVNDGSNSVVTDTTLLNNLGLASTDLDGKYFKGHHYFLTSEANTYKITCKDTLGVNRSLDINGNFTDLSTP